MSRLAPLRRTRIVFTILVGGSCAASACSPGAPAQPAAHPVASAPAPSRPPNSPTTRPVPVTTPTPTGRSRVTTPVVPKPPPSITVVPPSVTIPGKPLAGKVIALDPGHNGGNAAAPGVINQIIWNGREDETCDTTGTETDAGYTEAQFNFNVAEYLAADLEAEGATVVLTRTSNTGVGPCVTERAAIGNNAHADAAISIHADGGPPTGRGFAILEPVPDGPNDGIITASHVLALDIRTAFLAGTGEPVSSYDGTNGLQLRNDLGGLNLSTVPKVLIECANMRNPTDAALLTTGQWQQSAARALAAGLTAFLT
jgi:N-acetylmuramoyl-L-alanine amidase